MSDNQAQLTENLFDDGFKGPLDPFAIFAAWFAEAQESELNDPNAMSLATVDENGLPDVRAVLMNGRDDNAIHFFTNLESAKGRQLLASGKAATLFHWKSLRRQVRFRGPVTQVTDAEADTYFASRPRRSQIGAHASAQSRRLDSRADLVARVEALEAQFGDADVPRPAYWSGFRLTPLEIEFWKDGAFRLHDRVVFKRSAPDGSWSRERLNP